MNFDAFAQIRFCDSTLLEHCRAAERSVRVEPFNSITSARTALEILCKGLLYTNNLKVEPDGNGSKGLSGMVETCFRHNLFQTNSQPHQVRTKANKALHVDIKKGAAVILATQLEESLHLVVQENIHLAQQVVEFLYETMRMAFGYTQPEFDPEKIPFNEYEIHRAVPKAQREVVVGNCNYFVKNPANQYFYLQIFPKNAVDSLQTELTDRNHEASAIVWEDPEDKMVLQSALVLFDHSKDSDREVIAYPAFSDSLLLSELKKPMSPQQAVQVCRRLVQQLREMMNLEKGLHHRNIQPGCVLLRPVKDGYKASLVNFQTVKIQDYDKTIAHNLEAFQSANLFMPLVLRHINTDRFDTDWERVDVYSVAKVLVYCVAPHLLKREVDAADLYDIFSDTMVDRLQEIFESSLPKICSLSEFEGYLKDEAAVLANG